MGSCEIYPQTLQHSANGRYVVACGDGEYIVYTATALRNKAFGSGLEFVWAKDPSIYAVRESASSIKIHKNFKVCVSKLIILSLMNTFLRRPMQFVRTLLSMELMGVSCWQFARLDLCAFMTGKLLKWFDALRFRQSTSFGLTMESW
jgi:hypothetical protein